MRALVAVVVLWASVAAADFRPTLDARPLAPPRGAPGPWPLSELPSVQPHLDLAMAHDACTPAAQKRQKDDELRAYLTAWCRIRVGEHDAVDALAPLARSRNIGLARASLLDIVNLIADHEARQPAVTHLDRLRLVTPHALDLLAATYLALGQDEDASYVGKQAIAADKTASAADACERELAWSSLDQLHVRERDTVEARRVGLCQHRLLALDCALAKAHASTNLGARLIAMRECYAALPDDPDLDAKLLVIAAYTEWKATFDAKYWLGLARTLEPAFAVRGAEQLAVAGLEWAHANTCRRADLDAIAAGAKRIAAVDRHDAVFDRRLADLAKLGQQCRN